MVVTRNGRHGAAAESRAARATYQRQDRVQTQHLSTEDETALILVLTHNPCHARLTLFVQVRKRKAIL